MYKVTVNVSSTSSGFRLYDTIGVVDYGLDVGENTFYRIPSSSTSGFNVTVLGLAGTTGEVSSVSVKEYTSADMDVTRATAATRVDENGLVNYAEVIGDEEITNGDFATDSDWIKAPSGVTISGGSANFNSASDTYVYQDILTAPAGALIVMILGRVGGWILVGHLEDGLWLTDGDGVLWSLVFDCGGGPPLPLLWTP